MLGLHGPRCCGVTGPCGHQEDIGVVLQKALPGPEITALCPSCRVCEENSLNDRITERLGLEWALKIIKLQSSATGVPPISSGCPETHPAWPWAPPAMGRPQPFWAACAFRAAFPGQAWDPQQSPAAVREASGLKKAFLKKSNGNSLVNFLFSPHIPPFLMVGTRGQDSFVSLTGAALEMMKQMQKESVERIILVGMN